MGTQKESKVQYILQNKALQSEFPNLEVTSEWFPQTDTRLESKKSTKRIYPLFLVQIPLVKTQK